MEIQWEKTTCQQTGIGFVCLTSKRQPNKWDNICVALNTIIIVKRSRSFFSTSFYCTVWVYTFRWFFPSSWRIFFRKFFFLLISAKQLKCCCIAWQMKEKQKSAQHFILYIFFSACESTELHFVNFGTIFFHLYFFPFFSFG